MSLSIRAGRWIALVVLQLFVVLVVLEGIARVFDPLGISYYPEMARYLDSLVLEEPIGYRNRPGLQDRFFGVPVSINSLGLRDREVQDKAAGEFRILVMGDSVPFGIGVRYEDSFPHQLETLLQERQPTVRFRTLNMGVPSYNTEQELFQLRSLGLTLKPDAALLPIREPIAVCVAAGRARASDAHLDPVREAVVVAVTIERRAAERPGRGRGSPPGVRERSSGW